VLDLQKGEGMATLDRVGRTLNHEHEEGHIGQVIQRTIRDLIDEYLQAYAASILATLAT
jgi:hypothetical protein